MRLFSLLGTAALALALTACPTTRPFDSQNSENLKNFGPNAVASSTQFLKGAPVSALGATEIVMQFAKGNPKLEIMLKKAPENLGMAFSSLRTQASSTPFVLPAAYSSLKLSPQAPAGGNKCGVGSTTDADGDGIPLLFNYNFDCNTTYNGVTAVLLGDVYIKDYNDNPNTNGATSGYEVKLTNLTFYYIDPANNFGIALQTNLDTKVTVGANGKYTITQNFNFIAVSIDDGVISSFEYSTNGTLEYTPQPSATNNDRFARGTLKFNNRFSFKVNNAGNKYESSLEFSSNAMIVDRNACGSNKMVNSGNVKFTDGKNTLTWTITGCGDGTWNYQ